MLHGIHLTVTINHESVDIHVYNLHIDISQDAYGDVQPALKKSTDLRDIKGIHDDYS